MGEFQKYVIRISYLKKTLTLMREPLKGIFLVVFYHNCTVDLFMVEKKTRGVELKAIFDL